MHFPTDLLAGWILGGIILAVFFPVDPVLTKYLTLGGARFQNISAAAAALIMNGLYPGDGSFPAIFLGFCLGYSIMTKYFPFSAHEEINGKKPGLRAMALRCLTGFAGIAIIYTALRLLLPGEGSLFSGAYGVSEIPLWGDSSPFSELGRFIRYGLIGFWASAGAPKVFQRTGLASTKKYSENSANKADSASNSDGEEP